MPSRLGFLPHKRCALLFSASLLVCACALAQEPKSVFSELVNRSNALTDLAAAGPYEFRARITVEPGSEHEQQGEITIDRGRDGSRMELRLGDFHQVEVLSQGTRHVWRSQPFPVIGLETLQGLEDALQLRTSFPPETKYSRSYQRKVGGMPATCIDARPPFEKKLRFCFDVRTGALLEASDSRGWRGRFSGYAAAANGIFPGRMELTLPWEPRHLEFAQVQVTSQNFDAARFAPPQGALAFAACDRMAPASPAANGNWAILNRQQGEVYLYAIVEGDGSVHHLNAYGTHNKWLRREVMKQARDWRFYPARCNNRPVTSELLLPLMQVNPPESYSSPESFSSAATQPGFDTRGYIDQYDRQIQNYTAPP